MTILPSLRQGLLFRFFSALFMFCSVAGVDATGILDFGVSKYQRFVQEDSDPPEAFATEGFLFVASFTIDDPERPASGKITLPNGVAHELVRVPFGANLFHTRLFNSAAALHDAYPFGNYTFELTVDGMVHTATVRLVETPFPGAPHIVNYDDLQDVDGDAPFTVEWASIPGATSDDYIFLSIEDYESPEPWEADTLTGADTSATISEGVLMSGNNEGALSFARIVDRNTAAIPGALGVAVVGSWTEFEISATGGGTGDLQITTSFLPPAQLNVAYATNLQASGPVFLWLVEEDDQLPNGIQVNPLTGELSGIATEAGTFTFTVTAVSMSLEMATRSLTLTVSSDDMAPPIIGGSGFVGGLFFLTIPSPDGRSVAIEVSSNLAVWLPLAVIAPVSGVVEFQDTQSLAFPSRFYRVRWQ